MAEEALSNRELARVVTEPRPCPYLKDREARTELRLLAGIGIDEYAGAIRAGFRRFGTVVFRPACETCRACTPIRVVVRRFRPSKSQRRVLRRNRDVRIDVGPPGSDDERIDLHRAFHRERSEHVGWKLEEIGENEYRRTFVENCYPTLELSYRIGGRLAAVAYIDQGPDALNSIYCFHHPDHRRRSLGTFDILVQVDLAARLGLEYLYLGYYVAGCRSMEYKASFRPCEVLIENRWVEFVE